MMNGTIKKALGLRCRSKSLPCKFCPRLSDWSSRRLAKRLSYYSQIVTHWLVIPSFEFGN